MKDTTTSVLGFDVPVTGVPTTLAESVTAAGGEEKLVAAYVDYITYHKTNTSARSAVVDALEEVLGIKRKTRIDKTTTSKGVVKEVEKYDESEQTFADRAVPQSGKTRPEVWDLIKESVGAIPFQGMAREGGVGRLAKQDTEQAGTLIKEGKWQAAVNILQTKNPGLTIELDEQGVAKVESLAMGLRTNRRRLENEAKSELGIAV